ncbi:MAG TPA: potassium channel family protein [Rubrivivax sp.]
MARKPRSDAIPGDQMGLNARFASPPLPHARRVEVLWRWPTVLVLLLTVPSFYVELLHTAPPLIAVLSYVLAAAVMAAALIHTGWINGNLKAHLYANRFDLMLCAGLLIASVVPPSASSTWALGLRLVVGFFTMARMFWAAHYVVTRGGTLYRLIVALLVLLLCGTGFWWLEPTTPTLEDGLWLAFTTAATVGYGDFVPTTPASKIFAVFVVFLGVGAVTLVTAAIASAWVEIGERHIEREMLHDLRQQLNSMHEEIAALRAELRTSHRLPAGRARPSNRGSVGLQREQPVEDQ